MEVTLIFIAEGFDEEIHVPASGLNGFLPNVGEYVNIGGINGRYVVASITRFYGNVDSGRANCQPTIHIQMVEDREYNMYCNLNDKHEEQYYHAVKMLKDAGIVRSGRDVEGSLQAEKDNAG